MVTLGLQRWGSRAIKEEFAVAVSSGQLLCALALSEPEAGSDAASVKTEARADGESFILNGVKKWTTFGQIAGLFLIVARFPYTLAAFLVPASSPGLVRSPMKNLLA